MKTFIAKVKITRKNKDKILLDLIIEKSNMMDIKYESLIVLEKEKENKDVIVFISNPSGFQIEQNSMLGDFVLPTTEILEDKLIVGEKVNILLYNDNEIFKSTPRPRQTGTGGVITIG